METLDLGSFEIMSGHVSDPANPGELRSRIWGPQTERLDQLIGKHEAPPEGRSSKAVGVLTPRPGLFCWSSILQPSVPSGLQSFQCALLAVSITWSLSPQLSFIYPHGLLFHADFSVLSLYFFFFLGWRVFFSFLHLLLWLRRISLKRRSKTSTGATERNNRREEICEVQDWRKTGRNRGCVCETRYKTEEDSVREKKRNCKLCLSLGSGESKPSILIEGWRNPQSELEQPFITLSSSVWRGWGGDQSGRSLHHPLGLRMFMLVWGAEPFFSY